MDVSTLILAAFGIGLVIFVHELGHFLAARRCGVRVDVFSIGMGPRVFSWKRGDTRYQLALLPIGGYVRMGGEDRRMDGLPPEPGDLGSKSVGARFFVYSGGVLMNLLFGLVVFPLVFFFGVPLDRPVVDVVPGGPAWRAGLPDGTEVLSVNGRDVFEFGHIPTAVALGDPDDVELLVREPRAEEPRHVELDARYDEGFGMHSIGVLARRGLRGPNGGFVLDVEPDSPAARAGVPDGAELLGIAGAPEHRSLAEHLARLRVTGADAGEPMRIRVITPAGAEETFTLEPTQETLQEPRVGVSPPRNRVEGLRGRAKEVAGLRAGDRLVTVGGRRILRAEDLETALVDALPEALPAEVPFVAERDGERREGAFRIASRDEALALLDDVALGLDLETNAVLVSPGEPAALAGLRDGDRLLEIDGSATTSWEETRDLIRSAEPGASIAFDVSRRTPDGAALERVEVTPAEIPAWSYGLVFRPDDYVVRASGPWDAVRLGVLSSWRFAEDVVMTLKRLLTADVAMSNVGGPITIGAVSYSLASTGWAKLFWFLALLSINLAIINVLPIPLLDGGHLTFLIIEKIKGSPVSERVLVYSQVVGMVLLVTLMVFVTYHDLVRWILPAG